MSFPIWLCNLTNEEINFIKDFMLVSGSIKSLSEQYRISYPTMRNRLDALIDKIKLYDFTEDDSYVAYIKQLALENKIDINVAKNLITKYRIAVEEGKA